MNIDRRAQREPKRRVHHFPMLKQRGIKITMVTAYDYPTGLAADEAGADAILVGDSLGMVALGYDSTIPVTMDDMIHHGSAVRRGVRRAFVVIDMPFLSYSVAPEQAVMNAGKLIQQAGAEAVKLEGGRAIVPMIERIAASGIPVVGHIGLTPQSVHKLGGYRVQGRHDESARELVEDAKAVEAAGAFAIVLEAISPDVAAEITSTLHIPTIGIGAGRACDGQVLVISDLAGLVPGTPPKFVKQYSTTYQSVTAAVRQYCDDVRAGKFPEEKHEY